MYKVKVKIKDKFLELEKAGKKYTFELKKLSKRLAKATDEQLSRLPVMEFIGIKLTKTFLFRPY